MIDRKKLQKVIATGDKELVSHSLCEVADDIFYKEGAAAVPSTLRTIVSVETFFGEVTNGGIIQFLGNDHGAFAPYVVDALAVVGLPEASEVMRRALAPFPIELSESIDPDYIEALELIEEVQGDDFLDKIEKDFWTWYHDGNRTTIRDRLHEWIVANEAAIAAGN